MQYLLSFLFKLFSNQIYADAIFSVFLIQIIFADAISSVFMIKPFSLTQYLEIKLTKFTSENLKSLR